MSLSHTAMSLGSLSLHRTMEQDTLSAYVSLCADTGQFTEPQQVLHVAAEADMSSQNEDEIIVGEMSAAITFFNSVPAGMLGDLSCVPDISDRLNDQVNFHVRVPAITRIVSPYLKRLNSTLRDTPVRGFMFVEQLRAAPGFSRMDVLSAGLGQLQMLTAASSEGIFWVHSEQDEADSRGALHKAMAEQFKFKQMHPIYQTTTFPDVGPIAGTMAGIIPGSARWTAGDDWSPIRSSFQVNPGWLENLPQDMDELL